MRLKRSTTKVLLFIMWITGCSNVRLIPFQQNVVASVVSRGQFCTSSPEARQRLTAYLFVVDKSRSNTWTDLNAQKRRGQIENFIRSTNLTNSTFGIVTFNGASAKSLVTDPESGKAGFSQDLDVLMDATAKLQTEVDNDATPYKAALLQTIQVVNNQKQAHPEQDPFYYVIFVSDGGPTDLSGIPEAKGLVQTLVDQNPHSLVLSTALYGTDKQNGIDPKAVMTEMANVGGGRFIDFQNGPWNLQDLVVKPTVEPWQLKTFLVYNLNAAFCLDGKTDVDSDTDGMCDRDEVLMGFDPTHRFSKGDGYGDYFHWREIKYGENLPECADQSDDDHDLLTGCEEAYIRNENPSIGDVKNGDPRNPDTDGDGVIDGIETFVYMPRTMAMAMEPFNLGDNNYDNEEPAGVQIQQHRNPLVRDPDVRPYDTNVSPIVTSRGVDCYGVSQNYLPLMPTLAVPKGKTLPGLEHKKFQNNVLVYYLQAPQSSPRGKGAFRYLIQAMTYGFSAELTVFDDMMKTYTPPKSN